VPSSPAAVSPARQGVHGLPSPAERTSLDAGGLMWHPTGVLERVKERCSRHQPVRQERRVRSYSLVRRVPRATSLGEKLAPVDLQHEQNLDDACFGRRGGISLALLVKVAYWSMRPVAWQSPSEMPSFWSNLYELTTPFDKYPPDRVTCSPTECASVLVGGLLLAVDTTWQPGSSGRAVIGRASLFVFVAQCTVLCAGPAPAYAGRPLLIPTSR